MSTKFQNYLCNKYFSETVASCEDKCDVCINSRAAVPSNCYSDASVVMECFTDIRKLCNKVTPQLLQLTLLGSKAQDIKLKHFGKANADLRETSEIENATYKT